ncbi:cupin domain-containing protein [Taibaiella soli]|uniref:Cupin domain-containing protein n=1 Tax=Taibaiella soli TaxID=1649169 RepID=A0A2W2BTD4_9BACT|nr:cupin domain-containing protein [Taibaiella soli]PZF71043.1 cupin domain-containing protein [Taibaiella soli]
MQQEIKIKSSAAGEHLGVAGGNYRIIISGEETQGNYAVIEMLVPPGGGPPPHAHPKMQEMFYVLEGEVLFKTESGKTVVKKDGFVNIPLDGGIHCFKNTTEKNARLLCTVVPAGLEKVFEAIGVPVQPSEFAPRPEMTPELKERLKALDIKHGQTTYPPDYLD